MIGSVRESTPAVVEAGRRCWATGDKGYASRQFSTAVNDRGVRFLRPQQRDERDLARLPAWDQPVSLGSRMTFTNGRTDAMVEGYRSRWCATDSRWAISRVCQVGVRRNVVVDGHQSAVIGGDDLDDETNVTGGGGLDVAADGRRRLTAL
jgi:hypothetical protein